MKKTKPSETKLSFKGANLVLDRDGLEPSFNCSCEEKKNSCATKINSRKSTVSRLHTSLTKDAVVPPRLSRQKLVKNINLEPKKLRVGKKGNTSLYTSISSPK